MTRVAAIDCGTNSIRLLVADVDPAAYDAVFYPGGHGPMLDLASDPVNAKIASEVRVLRLCCCLSLGIEELWGSMREEGSKRAGRGVGSGTVFDRFLRDSSSAPASPRLRCATALPRW